jgi:hypothetical protein
MQRLVHHWIVGSPTMLDVLLAEAAAAAHAAVVVERERVGAAESALQRATPAWLPDALRGPRERVGAPAPHAGRA